MVQSAGIGTDIISGYEIVMGGVQVDAIVAVAGNDVARFRGHTADEVVMGPVN